MKEPRKVLIISTPYRDEYYVTEKRELIKREYFERGDSFSGGWLMDGLVSVRSHTATIAIPFERLFAMTSDELRALPLLYKNGHPKFTVRDNDHGTTRTWGNTNVHGVKGIRFGYI